MNVCWLSKHIRAGELVCMYVCEHENGNGRVSNDIALWNQQSRLWNVNFGKKHKHKCILVYIRIRPSIHLYRSTIRDWLYCSEPFMNGAQGAIYLYVAKRYRCIYPQTVLVYFYLFLQANIFGWFELCLCQKHIIYTKTCVRVEKI